MESVITLKDLPSLKKSYDLAVKKSQSQFIFQKAVILTAYAKYLIEYLESLK